MDIELFVKMLKDKHFTDYQKMQYKYGEDFNAFLQSLGELYYKNLPLSDFDGNNIVFIEDNAVVNQSVVKLLLQSQNGHYGIIAAEVAFAVDLADGVHGHQPQHIGAEVLQPS